MTKAEKTREFIVERSSQVFNTKGYAGTSLSDIMEVTGLTKGAIYGNFENKDEVATAVYHYHVENLDKRIRDFLKPKPTCLEKLIGLTEYYRLNWKKVFERGGCPLLNAAVEADDNLGFMKKPVQQSIQNWAASLGRLINKGKETGEFRKNISTEEYSYSIIMVLEGGMMMGKIMNDRHFLFSALDRIERMIHEEIKK